MSRYIDADKLIRKYIDTDIEKFSNSDVKIVLENLKQNILRAPSIDIVFCKECSWAEETKFTNVEGDTVYMKTCPARKGIINDNDFCSYGERKENE